MTTVLITGANRGLGLEFCKQYAQEGWQVIACCREVSSATALAQLATDFPTISIYALDISDFNQLEQLALKLKETPIDVLLNNAGVYGDTPGHGFGHLDYQAWQHTMNVNVFSTVKMTELFLTHLQHGNHKKIVSISSLMGSMADNGSGGSIVYRSSKAALNAAMKSISIDIRAKDISVLILHPGWVKTDMGGLNAPMEISDSVHAMRETIANFTLAQTGQFLRYDGKPLPW